MKARSAAARSRVTAASSVLLATQLGSPVFRQLVELVAPGLLREPKAYRGCVFAAREGRGWYAAKKERAAVLLAEHFAADAFDVREGLEPGDLRSVGVRLPPGTLTELVNIDLDGTKYEPRAVVAALRKRLGSAALMPISGSGRPGRFRVLLRVSPMPVELVNRATAELLRSVGFQPVQGGAEVYPSTVHNSRVPFGAGGCVSFDLELEHGTRRTPAELFATFLRLERVSLEPFAVVHETSETSETKRNGKKQRRKLERSAHSVEVIQWLRCGVGPGERDLAARELTVHFHRSGLTVSETIATLKAWAPSGLARSELAQRPRALAAYIREKIPADVARYYERYPLQGRPAPTNLTRADVLAVLELAERAAADAPEYSVSQLTTFMLRAAPTFRAAQLAGLEHVRVTWTEWKAWSRGLKVGADYQPLRAACRVFEQRTSYIPKALARRPGDARSAGWSMNLAFEKAESPRRSLVAGPLPYLAALRVAAKSPGRNRNPSVPGGMTPKSGLPLPPSGSCRARSGGNSGACSASGLSSASAGERFSVARSRWALLRGCSSEASRGARGDLRVSGSRVSGRSRSK